MIVCETIQLEICEIIKIYNGYIPQPCIHLHDHPTFIEHMLQDSMLYTRKGKMEMM